jgi:hypothetical protein
MDAGVDITLVVSGLVLLLVVSRLRYLARTHVTALSVNTSDWVRVSAEQARAERVIERGAQSPYVEAPAPAAPAGETAHETLDIYDEVKHSASVLPELFRYVGIAKLPKRIYVGNAQNITLDLKRDYDVDPTRGLDLQTEDAETLKTGKEELQPVKVDLQVSGSYLEAELVGSGFETDNAKRIQRHRLPADIIAFAWGCTFSESGIRTPAIALRAVEQHNGEERVESLGRIEQRTVVVQFDGMTKRLLDNITWAAGLLGGASSAVGLVKTGYDLGHHFGWW